LPQRVVVTGHKREEIEVNLTVWFNLSFSGHIIDKEELSFDMESLSNKIFYVFNPEFSSDMFISLKTGLEHLRNVDWILYHFVDQPHLPERFYYQFVQQIDLTFDWIQPIYQKKKGHPVLFNWKVAEAIRLASKNPH